MKIRNILSFVFIIFELSKILIKGVPVDKSDNTDNETDIWGPPNTGGMNYFHIGSTKEFAAVRKLTSIENDELQDTCGYVKKNHLASDVIPEDDNVDIISKRDIINNTDFEGRDGFNAIAYAHGKVPEGAAPWAVAIGHSNSASCSGTIISPYHVLTAAHCLFKYENPTTQCVGLKTILLDENSRVYYGGTCLKKSVDNLCKHKSVKEKKIRRASYNYVYHLHACSHGSDLAILEVDSRFEFDEMTQPICLPPGTFNEKVDMPPSEIIHNLGFGKTELNMTSVYLRRGKSLVCSNDAMIFDNLSNSFNRGLFCHRGCTINDNVDCLGYDGMRIGICKGDSGGTDYIRMSKVNDPIKQRYMIIGVHSSGSECSPEKLVKKVFHHSVRVSYHINEICWLTGICPENKIINLW